MMILNKNKIPINRWESIAIDEAEKDRIYEFSLPPGTIKVYELDKQIDAFAIVQSYRQDYLYVSGNPLTANRKIHQLCGKRLKYGCTAIPERKGA